MTRGSSTEKHLPTFTYDEERGLTSYNIMQIVYIRYKIVYDIKQNQYLL